MIPTNVQTPLEEACELYEALQGMKDLLEPDRVAKAIFGDVGYNGRIDDPENRIRAERLKNALTAALV